jgi:DNA-directed RNA polymerase subunit RPC12/RpoP
MTISFHCESCKKKIKAPDEAGGKWGKCPYCTHRCYVPLPKSDDEPELKLAPIDDAEETHMTDLMRQTRELSQKILHERQALEDTPGEDPNEHKAIEKDIIKKSILYLRQMADGELQQAEKTFEQLRRHKKPSLRILSAMARAERPEPELSDIADNILQGLIRDASTKLSA